MGIAFFLVGILGIIAGVVLVIVALVKRSSWWLLRSGAIFGTGLLLAIVGVAIGVEPSEEVILPTPTVQETPMAELGKTRSNPIPLGSSLRYGDIEVTVLGLERHAEIGWNTPDEGKVYAVATIRLQNLGPPNETAYYSPFDFRVVGSKGKIYTHAWILDSGNILGSGEFFGGSTVSGDVVYEVDEDDADLVLIWSASWGISRFFALEE